MLKAWKRPNQVICCFRPPMKCSFLSVQVDIRYPILKPLNMSLMRAVVGSIQSIPSEFDSCGCFFCLILIIIYHHISPYIYISYSHSIPVATICSVHPCRAPAGASLADPTTTDLAPDLSAFHLQRLCTPAHMYYV